MKLLHQMGSGIGEEGERRSARERTATRLTCAKLHQAMCVSLIGQTHKSLDEGGTGLQVKFSERKHLSVA